MSDILNTDNYNFLFNSIVEYSPKILLGIFFLFFGLRLIKKSISILDNFLKSRQIDYLFTFEKDEIVDCPNCKVKLKISCVAHIAKCGKCKNYIRASDKKSSKEQINNIKKIEEQNKKRKLDNEELKSSCNLNYFPIYRQ